MNEVEKEVREILKGIAGRVYCKYCDGYDFECGCSIDVNERNVDQATTVIMAIMKAKNESWQIICKDKQTKIDKFQSDLAEKEKEIKQLMVFIKQTGAVQDQDGNWECTECEAVEETKRLRKIVDKVSVIKYADSEGTIRGLKYSEQCEIIDLLEKLEQALKGEKL